MLQVVQSTAPQSQTTTPPVSAAGGGTNDDQLSSAAVSDQVTMASPFGDHHSHTTVAEADLKSTRKREIQIGLMNATQNIRDLPMQQVPKQSSGINALLTAQVHKNSAKNKATDNFRKPKAIKKKNL